MSANTATQIAQEVSNEVPTSVDTLEEQAQELAKFDVPMDEIKRKLINEHSGEPDEDELEPEAMMVDDISDGDVVSLTVAVTYANTLGEDGNGPYQILRAGDETGSVRLTMWDSSLGDFEEGDTISVEPAFVDTFQGELSVNVNEGADIAHVEDDIEARQGQRTVGRVIKVFDGTGLIKRCSHDDCNKSLSDGECYDHGSVKGEPEMRVGFTMETEDGDHIRVYFNEEQASELLGIEPEDAIQEAREQMDNDIFEDDARDALMGKKVKAYLSNITDDMFYTNEVVFVGESEEQSTDRAEALLAAA
jgi:replication factor A1